MADSSALRELLDHASRVFSLAGELGRAFQDEHQRQDQLGGLRRFDSQVWKGQESNVKGFLDSVVMLGESIQNPPDGFQVVAQRLRETKAIVRRFEDALQRPDGGGCVGCLELWPDLNSIADRGGKAVQEARKARRLDERFAFLDEPSAEATVKPTAAEDTTGEGLIERLLVGSDNVELTPRDLAYLEAYLMNHRPTLVELANDAQAGDKGPPSDRKKLEIIRGFNRNLQAATEKDRKGLQDAFSRNAEHLAAQQELYQGRQEVTDESTNVPLNVGTTDAAHLTSKPKAKRRGRPKADAMTLQREAEIASQWQQAHESGVYKAVFAKDNGLKTREFDAILNRVRKRKKRSDK